MKMKITVKDYNIQTGLETISEREETEAEIKNRTEYEALRAARNAEAEAKAAQKAIVLTKLGLTADEAAALLG
jgi:hypothetical protein